MSYFKSSSLQCSLSVTSNRISIVPSSHQWLSSSHSLTDQSSLLILILLLPCHILSPLLLVSTSQENYWHSLCPWPKSSFTTSNFNYHTFHHSDEDTFSKGFPNGFLTDTNNRIFPIITLLILLVLGDYFSFLFFMSSSTPPSSNYWKS